MTNLIPLAATLTTSRAGRMPRVLFAIPGGGSGHSMIFVRRQIDALRAAGVVARDFYLGARTSPGTIVRECRRFRQTIHDFMPDLVHAQYGTVTACFCLISTRLPVVVTFRGSDLNPCRSVSRAQSLAGRLLSQVAAIAASGVVCVSEPLRDRVWFRKAIHIIPSGVDTGLFYPRDRTQARAELGWAADDRVILFNAGTDPVTKGFELAKKASGEACRLMQHVRLEVLYGNTPPLLMPTYLNAADCLLVTSLFEGSPNIVKEALACNLPVVSVDVGDVRQRLEGVIPSAVVESSPGKVAEALVRILSAAARSNGCSRAAGISSSATAAKILAVYQKVLASERPRLVRANTPDATAQY